MINYDAHSWIDHLFDIRGSLLREISSRIALCTIWAGMLVVFNSHVYPIGIQPVAHNLVGVALGLLLVFRTNSSYDRFWEGRKLWGGIVNETRNLMRASEAFLGKSPEARREIALWAIAFSYASMNILRGSKGLGPVAKELDPLMIDEALKSQHPALTAAKNISKILERVKNQGFISEYVQVAIDQNVQLLVDYLGGCERIHKTPLPFAYVVHLRRALIFYFFTLPFALVDTMGWLTVAATFLVAFVFMGIEEIGVEIEDPFGSDENDLPLETICTTIETNLKGMLTGERSL